MQFTVYSTMGAKLSILDVDSEILLKKDSQEIKDSEGGSIDTKLLLSEKAAIYAQHKTMQRKVKSWGKVHERKLAQATGAAEVPTWAVLSN